jgi:putative transposase
VTPAAKWKAVAHLKEGFGMSERRACKAIDCCRMTVRLLTLSMKPFCIGLPGAM